MKKEPIKIGTVVFLILGAGFLAVYAQLSYKITAGTGTAYRVPANTTVAVYGPDGTCRSVQNKSATNDIFVTTNTTSEWNNFINYGSGVANISGVLGIPTQSNVTVAMTQYAPYNHVIVMSASTSGSNICYNYGTPPGEWQYYATGGSCQGQWGGSGGFTTYGNWTDVTQNIGGQSPAGGSGGVPCDCNLQFRTRVIPNNGAAPGPWSYATPSTIYTGACP